MTRFVLFGLGMVGTSFLKIIKKEGMFVPESWYAVDKCKSRAEVFASVGGLPSHYLTVNIKLKEYEPIFSLLDEGDYLLDFSSCQSNTDLLQICIEKNIHYLSTCSLPYEAPHESVPDYHDFCAYRDIKKHKKLSPATSIIEFGMNPGMVSCFAKQAIKEIIKNDKGDFVNKHRTELQSLLDNGKYAEVAQRLEVDIIHISDIDVTELNFTPQENTVYSTWNVEAFCKETTAPSEMSLGTCADAENLRSITQEYNPQDGFFLSHELSIHSRERSYSPYGSFTGYIVPHEEIYTISQFLSIYENDRLTYKPSVYFVYLPCPASEKCLFEGFSDEFEGMNTHLITSEDIAKGGEAVGIVIAGKNFTTRYFGNKLEAPLDEETPTILQVSASSFAAFRYMLDYPDKGFLFAEELDDEKILEYARAYLKEYISFECPPLERTFFSKYRTLKSK